MRISILDDYQKCITSLDAFSILKDHEVTIVHEYISSTNKLVEALNEPEAIVLTRTRTEVNEELLKLLPSLKVISQTGKNSGHIDVESCRKRGIVILEGRGDPTSTAELTWALIINGLRKLPQAIEGMKLGNWQVNIGRRIADKTIGIWGYGRIGRKVAHYAKAFNANVLVWGSKASRDRALDDGFKSAKSKNDFFSSSDVISLHLRLKKKTKHCVKLEDLLMMRQDALFVNTARASLIEKGALLKALKLGTPGFAAIDVFDEEPILDINHPLLKMSNVICTPHLGYVEERSYELYFGQAFQNIIDWLEE